MERNDGGLHVIYAQINHDHEIRLREKGTFGRNSIFLYLNAKSMSKEWWERWELTMVRIVRVVRAISSPRVRVVGLIYI